MKYETNDKLDLLIQLAFLEGGRRDVELFESIDDSDVVLSRRLTRRVRRTIAAKEREGTTVRIKHVLTRAVAAALIAMSLALVILLSVSATREAIFNAVVEWYEEYFTVQFGGEQSGSSDAPEATEPTPPETTEKPAPTPPATVEEIRKPTYLPNGVEEEIVLEAPSGGVYEYYIGDEWVGFFQQLILTDTKKYFDSEGAATENVFINDYTGLLITYEKKENILLVWSDEEYVYIFETEVLSVEDIISMAESVK